MSKANNNANDEQIVVTDHAVLRYLERVHGMDIEAIRNNLVSRRMKSKISKLKGTGEWVLSNGYRYVFQDYKLTTIKPPFRHRNKQ